MGTGRSFAGPSSRGVFGFPSSDCVHAVLQARETRWYPCGNRGKAQSISGGRVSFLIPWDASMTGDPIDVDGSAIGLDVSSCD